MHDVHVPDPSKKNFVGTISMRELQRKLRKPLPPPSKTHASKKAYRRKPKHPGQEAE
jgi:hypothetical protein